MDIKKIEKLMELMKTHQLTEIEVDEKGDRVRISMASNIQIQHAMPMMHAAPSGGQFVGTGQQPGAAAPAAAAVAPRKTLRSPFVGTYYEAGSPGSAPFVKVGDAVEPGQVLCIIESMKLMNEIEAEVSGTIVAKLVENGRPVEYGEALFAIRPR